MRCQKDVKERRPEHRLLLPAPACRSPDAPLSRPSYFFGYAGLGGNVGGFFLILSSMTSMAFSS
jgi:hypothetical protein